MIAIEVCPLANENVLPPIVDAVAAKLQIQTLITTFRNALCPEKRLAFDLVDDAMAIMVSEVQNETIRQIHCQGCLHRTTCYP